MFKDAYAQFPQSTVADKINRDGLIELYNNQDKYHEVEILNQVHDSIVFQIPIAVGWERITWILFDIKDALERPIPWNPPFVIPADFKIGLSLGDMIDINMCGKKEVCEQLSTWYDQHVGNK
jgi:hypothetical protein